ncbi:MAG: hypothetical protein QGG36_12040 [Pirellulaceae bacterium]|nr:hypothetical protein [Pirellulaceae bacterium]MDP7016526.1 hypothetical protein [Pirellulaceae bacterium]
MKQRARHFRAAVIIALVAASLPLVWRAATKLKSNTTDMRQWLPDGQDVRREYEWFLNHFGADDYLLVSWDGCTLDDERLEILAEALSIAAGPEVETGQPQLFRQVSSGPEFVDRLQSPPTRLSRRAAVARLRGLLIGNEDETCLLLRFTAAGKRNPRRIVETIESTARRTIEMEPSELYLGGPVYEVVSIDDESQRSLATCLPPSLVIRRHGATGGRSVGHRRGAGPGRRPIGWWPWGRGPRRHQLDELPATGRGLRPQLARHAAAPPPAPSAGGRTRVRDRRCDRLLRTDHGRGNRAGGRFRGGGWAARLAGVPRVVARSTGSLAAQVSPQSQSSMVVPLVGVRTPQSLENSRASSHPVGGSHCSATIRPVAQRLNAAPL